ncbi:MAG: DUF2934 domain-containing protein [Burkholderiales bacterium]
MSTHTKSKSSKAKADTRLTEEQRQHHIEVAAYCIAESGGFKGGCDLENWLAAETEIDRLLAEGKL